MRRRRPQQPKRIELSYYKALRGVVRFAWSLIEQNVLPLLPELVDKNETLNTAHLDVKPLTPQEKLTRLMNRLAKQAERALPADRLERIARKAAKETSEFNKQELSRAVNKELGLGIDRTLSDRVRRFVGENVSLIRSQPKELFADVEKSVMNGMRLGLRHEEIAQDLEDRLGIAEDRAALIARDQVLKFNGELNAVRQQNLGITEYVWNTVGDERTRDVHAERDGETFSWDDPPGDPSDPSDGGHPGSGINCRCWAEPILPEDSE